MNEQHPEETPTIRDRGPDPGDRPRIPDHELLRCIGQGSYGEVWLARNVFGAYRAVKVVYRDRFQDPRPFEREFAGAQRFEPISRTHDGFVDILHVGRPESRAYFYYVMELADDSAAGAAIDPDRYTPSTLRARQCQDPGLPIEECVRLGLALAAALEQLHRHGLVHRDLKPSNVIFVGGVPKLADIGLVTDSSQSDRSFVGTEGYLAPEGPGSVQADIYSLGVLLGQLRRHPGSKNSGDPRPETDRALEQRFQTVVACASDPNPATRYRSAQALLEALETAASPPKRWKRRISRAALVLFLIGAGLLWWTGAFSGSSRSEAGSVAVLPFVSLSSETENELWSDGLTEELIQTLSQVPGLRVPSRTTLFAWKDRTEDIQRIGHQLRVRAVLEGSVRRAESRMRISVQLVSVADGFQIWSASYDQEPGNALSTQREIAGKIVQAIKDHGVTGPVEGGLTAIRANLAAP